MNRKNKVEGTLNRPPGTYISINAQTNPAKSLCEGGEPAEAETIVAPRFLPPKFFVALDCRAFPSRFQFLFTGNYYG